MLKNDPELKLIIAILFVFFLIIAQNRFIKNQNDNTTIHLKTNLADTLISKHTSPMKVID